jgi:hypothetical protein
MPRPHSKTPSLRTRQRQAKAQRELYERNGFLVLPWFPIHPYVIELLVQAGGLPETLRDDPLAVNAALSWFHWQTCDLLEKGLLEE